MISAMMFRGLCAARVAVCLGSSPPPLPRSSEEEEKPSALRSARVLADMALCTTMALCDYSVCGEPSHLRSAHRFKRLAQRNGGMLCKFGQHVASLHHVVRPEYTEVLSQLTDQQPWTKETCRRLKELPLLDVEEVPVASASIAQVHKARLADGTCVAVKVMHAGLEQRIAADLQALKISFRLASLAYPKAAETFAFLLPEFEDSLKLELDLVQEGVNTERARALGVNAPRVYWDLTSRNVLTTQFIHGHRVDDMKKHKSLSLDPRAIRSSLLNQVAELAYVHGLVHVDPHGGNVLVDAQGKVWLLDHGLYRRLDESSRLGFCGLWDALARGDSKRASQAALDLGLGRDLQDALRIAKLLFPTSSKDLLVNEDRRSAIKGLLPEASERLRAAPRDLLFAFRSASLLRGQHAALGGSRRERYLVFAAAANKGLAISEDDDAPSLEQSPLVERLISHNHLSLARPRHPLNRATSSERQSRTRLLKASLLASLRVATLILLHLLRRLKLALHAALLPNRAPRHSLRSSLIF